MKRTNLTAGVYSASAISTLETCEQKAYLQYEEGWELKTTSNSLKTGILMHDAQEMYMLGHNEQAVINSIEQEAESRGWTEDKLFLPKLRSYIRGYYERWEAEDAESFTNGLEVLSVEDDFEFRLDLSKLGWPGDSATFVGRTDAVLLDKKNDCIILMEHKNVSSRECQDPASVFWQSLIMNNQLTIYSAMLEEKYQKPVIVWYDVMQTSPMSKPKLIKKVRETIEEFEERLTATYKNREENKYIRKTIPILNNPKERRMKEIIEIATNSQSRFYHGKARRNTQSCKNYGGCEFFNVCIGTELIHESPRFQKKEHFKPKENNDIPF